MQRHTQRLSHYGHHRVIDHVSFEVILMEHSFHAYQDGSTLLRGLIAGRKRLGKDSTGLYCIYAILQIAVIFADLCFLESGVERHIT